jgi:hypothetical protein
VNRKRDLSRPPAEIIALGLLLLLTSAASACREGKRTDDPNASPTSSPTSSVAMPAASTSAPVVTDDLKDASASAETDVDVDAGVDGGKRKLRRLGAGADASAPEPTAAVAAPSPATSVDARAGKRGVKPMGDELPYGGTGASAAPVLDKKPLVKEDPWGKPAPP